MCFFGGGDDEDEQLEGLSPTLQDFIKKSGGLGTFGGSVSAARRAFEKASVPGPAAEAGEFAGPRIDEDRTGVRDLKLPGGILQDRPVGGRREADTPPAPTPPRVPEGPTFELPDFPRIPGGGRGGRGGRTFDPRIPRRF